MPSDITDYAREGNLDGVKGQLAAGISINFQDSYGWTALMGASDRGHLDMDKFGFTALIQASGSGHLDIVKYLHQHGADINIKPKGGKTALDLARRWGHTKVVEYLEAAQSGGGATSQREQQKKAAEKAERQRRATEESERRKKLEAEEAEKQRRAAFEGVEKLRIAVEESEVEFKKIDEYISQLRSQQSCFASSGLLDPKFSLTAEEAAENAFIAKHPLLSKFNNEIQKSFNELFMAAAMLSAGYFKQNTSSTVSILQFASSIFSSLPFASMVLSGIASVYDTICEARQSANLQNIGLLNPSSNPVLMGVLSEAIAREFTLTYHAEIQQGSLMGDKSKIGQLKAGFRSFLSSISGGDSKVARGLVGPELSDIQYVAVDQASIAITYITSLTVFQVNLLAIDINTDRRRFAAGLVAKVIEVYPVSGPRALVIPAIPVADPVTQVVGTSATSDASYSTSTKAALAEMKEQLEAERKARLALEEKIRAMQPSVSPPMPPSTSFNVTVGGCDGQLLMQKQKQHMRSELDEASSMQSDEEGLVHQREVRLANVETTIHHVVENAEMMNDEMAELKRQNQELADRLAKIEGNGISNKKGGAGKGPK